MTGSGVWTGAPNWQVELSAAAVAAGTNDESGWTGSREASGTSLSTCTVTELLGMMLFQAD